MNITEQDCKMVAAGRTKWRNHQRRQTVAARHWCVCAVVAAVSLLGFSASDVTAAPGDPAAASPAQAQAAASALVRGDLAGAVENFTAALADRSMAKDRRATLLNDRAVALVRLGQTERAVQDYNAAVQLFPEYAPIYNNRGNLLLGLGYPREALRDFDRALVLAPGYAEAYHNRAAARLQIGAEAPEQADAAIRDFTQAIKLMPANPAPLSGRGRAYLAEGRPHAAIRDFSRAVRTDARFSSGYRNRAEAKLDVGHVPEAIEDLSRAIAFDANNAELYVLRGEAYLRQDNVSAAIKDFARANELDAKDIRAYEARGLSSAKSGDIDEAMVDLNRAIELNSRSARAYAFRGFAHAMAGQTQVGQQDIATALKLAPKSLDVLWAKAEVAALSGNMRSANADLTAVLQRAPRHPHALASLKRLGMTAALPPATPMPGLGIASWIVMQKKDRYFATSQEVPDLQVPLEMVGDGAPKLLEWTVRDQPFKGIGTLRFSSGTVAGVDGKPRQTEATAIVDVWERAVVAIQPTRDGAAKAKWQWNNGQIVVASVDGVTDEFVVRRGDRGSPSGGGTRRATLAAGSNPGYDYGGGPAWGTLAGQTADTQRASKPRAVRKKKVRRQKPKSLFDLLFNN